MIQIKKNRIKFILYLLFLPIITIILQGCYSKSILEYISCSEKEDLILEDEVDYSRKTGIIVNGQVVAGSVVKGATVNIYSWDQNLHFRLPLSYGNAETEEDGSFKIIIEEYMNLDNKLLIFIAKGGSFLDRSTGKRVNLPEEIEFYSLVYPSELGEYIAINTRTRFVKKIVEAKELKFSKNKKDPWRFGYYSELTKEEWGIVNQHKNNPKDIREAYVEIKKIRLDKDRTYSLYIDADTACVSYYRKFYKDKSIDMLNFYKKMDAYILTLSEADCLFYKFNLVDTKKSNLYEEHSRIWSSIALRTCLGDY